jgi:hypothetical protein
MSNRYEEVIRLVLDVESDKAEKKIVDAQDRANRHAVQRAREVAGVAEARVGTRSRGVPSRQGSTGAGGEGGRDVAGLYRTLGHVAGSIMRGRMPAIGESARLLQHLSGGRVGRPGVGPSANLFSPSRTSRQPAGPAAGNGGTLGSGRPPGMPPTPPAPPRRTPPPIPPGAPRLPAAAGGGGGGGFGNVLARATRTAAGKIGGGGAAGAAGIAGLVLVSLKHLASGVGKYTQAFSHWGKAFITGDASKALKGVVSYAQGMAHALGPVMGTVISKMLGLWNKVFDTLDGLVAALGKYNPVVNAQSRVLEVQQKMFRMRMANVFQPVMSAWISLKSTVLDLMSQLLPLLRPIVGFFASFIVTGNSFLRGIKAVFIDVIAAFKWVKGMLTGHFKSYSKVREEVRTEADSRSLDNAARQYNQSFANAGRTLAPAPVALRGGGFPRPSPPGPAPAVRLPGGRRQGSPRQMPEPGESLPRQATTGRDNRPSLPAPPGRPQFLQNVQNHWQFQLAAEKAINDTVMQVRDKLMSAMFSARDEARLVGSLVAAGVGGM